MCLLWWAGIALGCTKLALAGPIGSRTLTERTLGPTGVIPNNDKALPEEAKDYIKDILSGREFSEETVAAFLDDLDIAFSLYFSSRALQLSSAPPKVRDNLTDAMHAAEQLVEALSILDGNSALLIDEVARNKALGAVTHSRSFLEFVDKKFAIIELGQQELDNIEQGTLLGIRVNSYAALGVLELALGEANKLPDKRSGPDYAKQIVALAVRDAIESHLGVRATTTKYGLFGNVLSAVVDCIGNETKSSDAKLKEGASVHRLTGQAMKGTIIKHKGGAVEYIPAAVHSGTQEE